MVDRRKVLKASVAGLTIGTSGCSALFGLDSDQNAVTGRSGAPQYDPRRSGYSPTAGVQSAPEQLWELTIDRNDGIAPVVHDGTIYAGGKLEDDDGSSLIAVEARSGDVRWQLTDAYFSTYFPLYSTVSPVHTGSGLFVTNGKHVWRVDTEEHELTWERELGGAGLAVVDETVYVTGGGLRALDPVTGELRWADESLDESTAPSAGANAVYVGTYDDELISWGHDGRRRWKTDLGYDVTCPPTVTEDYVLVSTVDHGLHCLDAENGTRRWTTEIGAPVYASSAVSDGSVYLGATDGTCRSLGLESGELQWQFHAGGTIDHSFRGGPVTDGETVYLAGKDGFVYALDSNTGDSIWQFDVSDPISSPVSVVNGFIFLVTDTGRLVALEGGER